MSAKGSETERRNAGSSRTRNWTITRVGAGVRTTLAYGKWTGWPAKKWPKAPAKARPSSRLRQRSPQQRPPVSRDPNRQNAHCRTGGEGVLLDPTKDVVQRQCFDKYCATRDGYQAKAFKPPRWADRTGPWADRLNSTKKSQSANVSTTCTKIIYDKHQGENLAKMGASPMDCVCKLCGGGGSQHHIIRDCTHREMAACSDKHIAMLKRRSRDISARRYQAAPCF